MDAVSTALRVSGCGSTWRKRLHHQWVLQGGQVARHSPAQTRPARTEHACAGPATACYSCSIPHYIALPVLLQDPGQDAGWQVVGKRTAGRDKYLAQAGSRTARSTQQQLLQQQQQQFASRAASPCPPPHGTTSPVPQLQQQQPASSWRRAVTEGGSHPPPATLAASKGPMSSSSPARTKAIDSSACSDAAAAVPSTSSLNTSRPGSVAASVSTVRTSTSEGKQCVPDSSPPEAPLPPPQPLGQSSGRVSVGVQVLLPDAEAEGKERQHSPPSSSQPPSLPVSPLQNLLLSPSRRREPWETKMASEAKQVTWA
jgi:hypothetical protein